MKIKDAINMANLMENGNAMPKELAILFLSELDGMIQSDIMLHAPEEIVSYDNEEQELLLRPPHDKLYVHYLVMMIRNQQQEYEGYQNTQAAVDEKLKTFRRWYVQHYRPADTDSRSYMGGTSADAFGFAYLTAYGLAVRNGYQGTEEQWLESLHGETGDPGEPARMRYDADREMIQWGVGDTWYDLFGLQALRDPVVAEMIVKMEAAVKTARDFANEAGGFADDANEAAGTATAAAVAAAQSANMAQAGETGAKKAQAGAENAAGSAENHAVAAGNYAKAAEESAKRAEAAGNAGGGSTGHIIDAITGHNSNRNSHEDIRQYVQRNGDEIAALGRDKLDAAALPEAINTALAQARDSGDFDGADGRGIKSVARTFGNGAAGTVDTYTITYTDGTKSTYQVRNGAKGSPGDDGITPHIGSNGNWYIGDTDTGIKAQGPAYELTDEDKASITAAVIEAFPKYTGEVS